MRSSIIAGAILISGLSVATSSLASDWACKAILCLSNPGGPTQYSECVPPITKLYKAPSFPGCPSAGPYDISDFSRGRVTFNDRTGLVRPYWASKEDVGRRYVRYTNQAEGTKPVWLDERARSEPEEPEQANNFGRDGR